MIRACLLDRIEDDLAGAVENEQVHILGSTGVLLLCNILKERFLRLCNVGFHVAQPGMDQVRVVILYLALDLAQFFRIQPVVLLVDQL